MNETKAEVVGTESIICRTFQFVGKKKGSNGSCSACKIINER